MLISEQEFLNLNKEKEIEQHGLLLQTLNNQLTVRINEENVRWNREINFRLTNKPKPLFNKKKLPMKY
jgi:hypothetical protein